MSRLLLVAIGTLLIPIQTQSVTALAQQASATGGNVTVGESVRTPVVAVISDSRDAGNGSAKQATLHTEEVSDSCPTASDPGGGGFGHDLRLGCWWCSHRFRACSHSACSMPPHYPYFPSMHGYYYFRPYHHSHLVEQQNLAAQWGEDPRKPYANMVLKQVREAYEKERRELDSAVPASD